MIKLFVIEDHQLIVSGIKNIFRSSSDGFKVIDSAQKVSEAIEKINQTEPDIIILDLYLKDDNPIDNIQRLHESYPLLPIVILTVETSFFWQKAMFREGAKAYLNKGDSRSTIKTTLLLVSQGKTVIPCELQQEISNEKTLAQSSTLTLQEREILKEYSSGNTLKEIARRKGKSVSTIERMIQRIRRRVNAMILAELIKILFYNKEI